MKTRYTLAGALAGLLGAMAMATSAMAAPLYTMKLTTTTSADGCVEWLQTLKKNIDATSDGRIKVEVYPAGQLGSAQRTIEGVAMGTIEVAVNASGFYETLEPRFAVLSASGLFDSLGQGAKVLDDPEIRRLFSTYGKTKGFEVLGVFVDSPLTVVSKQPFQKISDLQGKKIRLPGSPLYIETFRNLGAAPTSMTLGEVLPAIQNGTLDGAVGGNTIFNTLKYYDVTKNMTYLPSTNISAVAIVSSQFMQMIGPDLSKIVRDAAVQADHHVYAWVREHAIKGRSEWEAQGGKSLTLAEPDAQQFLKAAQGATKTLFQANPAQAQDYAVFSKVAQKYRQP